MVFPTSLNGKRVTTKVKPPVQKNEHNANKWKTTPSNKEEFRKVSEKLTFMAYDKRTSSATETFFVDNGSDSDLKCLEVEISYFNSAGRLIHKRTVELEQEFPSKETRRADVQSWDKQKSFHYVNSVPSAKGSTPYTVRFKVLSFIVK